MKTIRIEIRVTAVVHVGDDIAEGAELPETVPHRTEEMTVRRIVSIDNPRDSSTLHATAKANTISILSGIAGVMPDKLAHGAREIANP